MQRIFLMLVAFAAAVSPAVAIAPGQVAVLYNSAVEESRELAEHYAEERGIPRGNLVGLPMPAARDISRAAYESSIRDPLRAHFDSQNWWRRALDANTGFTLPVQNRIRVIAVMRGVPLRVKPEPKPEDAPPPPADDPLAKHDEASVDSELAVFGVDGVPTAGVLQNHYFRSERPFAQEPMPFLVLTARIDGPGMAVSRRLIADAIITEKTGLWGMAYVDIANKFPQGDEWLEGIVEANRNAGIPTVVDRFNPTLPKNYPMDGAALYYGWYDHQVSGPFLNPRFRFRRGAVAVHIHSFSAAQIDNPARHWAAPLLAAGAAATVGNVYEPYLHLTHHLDILHDRLLKGFTWVEAAWMSMPCTSWQAVVLGDPLYRPFPEFPEGGAIDPKDADFRALALARKRWPDDDDERRKQLEQAIGRTKSGDMAEALALEWIDEGNSGQAALWLDRAATFHESPEDRLRLVFHRAAMHRKVGDTPGALAVLREAREAAGETPGAEALDAWITRLDPPSEPAADAAPSRPTTP